jgi:outer membrane autotransporter protein
VINTIDATLNGTLEIPVRQRGVLPAPTASTVYSDLMTWTNRTGTFTFEGPDSIFLVGNLIYHPTSLSAEIGRLPFNSVPAGLRGNDYAVATGLENAYPGAYARMDAQSVAFYSPMFDYSVGEYTQFLGTVSGSTYANALQATVFTSQLVNTVVDQRLSGGGGSLGTTSLDAGLPASAPGARTAWAAVLGNWANGDGDTNAPGFDQSTGGFALGLDYRVNAETLVGALAGYLSDRIDFDNNSSSDVDTWQLGAYGQYDTERWYANGLLTVGWNSYDAKRRIAFGNVSETAKGSYDGTTFGLYGEGGYKVPLGDWTVKPMLGLGYVNGDTDSFTEGGGSLYRLRVKGASGESFTSNLGVRASLERETAGGIPITGQVRAVWQHEFLDDQQQVDASFAVLPGSRFTVDGSRYARDSAVLGLGVKAEVAAGTDVFVSYDAKIGSDYTSNALFAGIRKTW